MVDTVNIAFKAHWNLHEKLSFDESSPGSCHRFKHVKRTPNKKVPSALQHWCLADAEHPYVWHFEALWDSQTSSHTLHLLPEDDYKGLSKTHKSVARILATINEAGRTHHHSIFLDNLFLHPFLVYVVQENLSHRMTGTWRSNFGMPKGLRISKIPKSSPKKLEEARNKPCIFAECSVGDCHLVGLSFYDTNAVSFLTNEYFNFTKAVGGRKKVLKFDIQHAYNTYMDAVTEGKYSTYLRSHKWWKRIFFWVLDLVLANNWRVFKFFHPEKAKRIDRDAFHESIALGLFTMSSELKNKKRRQPKKEASPLRSPKRFRTSQWPPKVERSGEGHWPKSLGRNEKGNLIRRRCQCCYSLKQPTKRTETNLYCSKCDVNLCIGCFEYYHTHE